MSETLGSHKPGDMVWLTVKRRQAEIGFLVKLTTDVSDGPGLPLGRPPARQLVQARLPPGRRADRVPRRQAQRQDRRRRTGKTALFSTGTYNDKSPTGQKVYGSLNDYYLEQSYGAFHVEGKVFDCVEVEKKRADYGEDAQPLRPADRGAGQAAGPRRQGRAEGLRRRVLPLRRRPGADDPRRPLLAAPRQRPPQGQELALLHLPRGRRPDGVDQRLLPRVRPHARPARPLRPPKTPAWRAWASGARCRSATARTASRSTSAPGARSSSAGSSRPSSTRPSSRS